MRPNCKKILYIIAKMMKSWFIWELYLRFLAAIQHSTNPHTNENNLKLN